jgi:pimeloyl-ACP methyl ester carboxylesterase
LKPDAPPSPPKKEVSFEVKGTRVSAWLYLPQDISKPVPCIVMGHGFGGTMAMGLERYAVRYQKAGYAVLPFDYRYFGKSDGKPRQLMLLANQLEDYAGAVKYVRSIKEIDPKRIALWGTSASGGYGIAIAARDENIACVISQCPGLDHDAAREMFFKELGLGHMLRLIMHGQRDMMRYRFGLSPHKIPIIGKPGSVAILPLHDAYDGYSKLASDSFINEVCARVMLRGHRFRPPELLKKVRCPVLIQICEHDTLAPIKPETVKKLQKHAEVKCYPIGHFDIYVGEHFEKAVLDQLDFFKKHL